MKVTKEYCDLCGCEITRNRENGWKGSLYITLKRNGNFHIILERVYQKYLNMNINAFK